MECIEQEASVTQLAGVAALLLSSCSYLALTSKADVARVESKTYICTAKESDAHPIPKPGVKALTANWRDPQDMRREIAENFNGCMQGEWGSGRVGKSGARWGGGRVGCNTDWPIYCTFWCHRVTLGLRCIFRWPYSVPSSALSSKPH